MNRVLEPLAQHRELVGWLKDHERAVWKWYSDLERKNRDAEAVKLSLLRDTYRMDREGHPELFTEIDRAKEALGLGGLEVSAYHSQKEPGPNAFICYLPGEAHLIFSGQIFSLLSDDELRAVIGHELAHYVLWDIEDGDYYLADRILHQAAAHREALPSHFQSARQWALATELFADRGSLLAAGEIGSSVAGLVKITTGLSQVSGKSYLAQADEIFSKSDPRSEQLTHPETYMRARALRLWADDEPELDTAVARMIGGAGTLDELDLIAQSRLTSLTLRFLQRYLEPAWFRSDAVLAHARMYFPSFESSGEPDESLAEQLAALPASHREYFCNVLLDFCAVDPELENLPLAAAIERAREIGCLTYFEKLAAKELKLKARDLKKVKENATDLLAAARGVTP